MNSIADLPPKYNLIYSARFFCHGSFFTAPSLTQRAILKHNAMYQSIFFVFYHTPSFHPPITTF